MTRSVLFVFVALALSSCDQLFQDHPARMIEKAQKKAEQGEYAGAVESYEAALDGTVNTADVHYRLGLLYDDKLKNPASAIHHFHRYLELAPGGAHAKDAKAFVKQDEFLLVNALSGGAPMTQAESARLKNENLSLRKQLVELRTPTQVVAGHGTPKPIPAGARTYVVQPHDTLASISRKFYKSTGRWKKIEEANSEALGGTVKLKPGQTLVIP
jgi:nucleoid-associated protein YgaU